MSEVPYSDLDFVGAVPVSKGRAQQTIEKFSSIAARATANADAESILDRIRKPPGSSDPVFIDVIEVIPAGAITVDATNFVTLNVYNRLSDGSGIAIIASLALSTGTFAAYVPFNLTIDRTQAPPKLNDVLTFKVVHSASGQTTPDMRVRIGYRA